MATQILIEVMLSTVFMGVPILVTGFEPFGGHETNISGLVASELSGENVRGHMIRSLVLPVDYHGATTVSKMLDTEKFAAIIHIGLAEKSSFPRIETRARDILDFRLPDNSGRLIKNSNITGKGDLYSTIKVEDWFSEQLTREIPPVNENPIRRTFNKFTNWLYGE